MYFSLAEEIIEGVSQITDELNITPGTSSILKQQIGDKKTFQIHRILTKSLRFLVGYLKCNF